MEVIDMSDSTIQLKKCNSCRENLPYDHFYMSKHPRHKDGFRDSCKGCEKGSNARTYKNRLDGFPDRIEARLPLRLNNSSTLDSVIAGDLMSEFLLIGKGVNNQLEYSLELNFLSGQWIATINEGQLQLRQLQSFPNIGWEGFKDTVGELLFKLEIKLESGKKVSTF